MGVERNDDTPIELDGRDHLQRDALVTLASEGRHQLSEAYLQAGTDREFLGNLRGSRKRLAEDGDHSNHD